MNYRSSNNCKRAHMGRRRLKPQVKLFLYGVILLVIIIFFANLIKPSHAYGSSKFAKAKYYKSYQIQDGDTLWSIADKYCDLEFYKDYNAYIKEVKQINHMITSYIEAGSYVIIPYHHYDDNLK